MFNLTRKLCKDSVLTHLIFTRNVRSSTDAIVKRKKQNPGVGKRIAAVEGIQDSEDLEDLETDFQHVGLSYKEHIKEQDKYKKKVQLKIVEQKYFKEQKPPSFLTWSDILQIRYLHNTNPDEWTIDKLSDGFPALPETIKKIVKMNYMKSESRVEKHNENVKTNWELFKKGKLQLTAELANHLKKFSSRDLNLKPFELPEHMKPKPVNIKLVEGEFSEIIKSYERITKKTEEIKINKQEENTMTNDKPADGENTYIIGNIKTNSKYSVPLSKLTKDIEKKSKKGEMLSQDEAIILSSSKSKEQELIANKNTLNEKIKLDLVTIDLENNKKVAIVQKQSNYMHLMYPEKITIPQKQYKKGCTYKLNDCYYDSDGTFLYRVPGMG